MPVRRAESGGAGGVSRRVCRVSLLPRGSVVAERAELAPIKDRYACCDTAAAGPASEKAYALPGSPNREYIRLAQRRSKHIAPSFANSVEKRNHHYQHHEDPGKKSLGLFCFLFLLGI